MCLARLPACRLAHAALIAGTSLIRSSASATFSDVLIEGSMDEESFMPKDHAAVPTRQLPKTGGHELPGAGYISYISFASSQKALHRVGSEVDGR